MQLLLLPGMDGTGRMFDPLIRALPATLTSRIVSYPPQEPRDYAALLPLVESAVRAGEFVVVGESFSGPLALMLAARRPPGLRGVVLGASFVRSPLPLPSLWRWLARPWLFRMAPLGITTWALLGRHRHGELGRMFVESLAAVSPEVLAARARALANVDVSAELRACPVPVMYLRAGEDRLVRARSWRLVKAARPDIEEVELRGPHMILQAAPAEAAVAIATFCERVMSK